MELEETRRNWDRFGRDDPLWAILTFPDRKNNRWKVEEFFQTGNEEIAGVLDALDVLGLTLGHARCLDFGCGVGRLTQALCRYFDRCDGVDIAASMIERAEAYNRFPDRCRYHLNTDNDLALFGDDTFDLLYTNAVMQHMEPRYALRYVADFVRVLTAEGLAVFEVPASFVQLGPLPEGAHAAAIELVADPPRTMEPGSRHELAVRVTNLAPVRWPWLGAPHPIRLGNHWLTGDGATVVTPDDGRAAMPKLMEPGDQAVFAIEVTAPSAPGPYHLQFDMVEEGVTWFAACGSRPCSVPVTCRPALATVLKRRLLPGRRPVADAPPAPPGVEIDQPVMEMHCIEPERVRATVAAAGGEVVHVDTYDAVGDGHTTCRYVIRRAPAPA